MSKRHWLRDEIDFGYRGEHRPHWDICNNCQIGDDCENCNAAAQEIADSLALYDTFNASDVIIKSGRLEAAARLECAGGYFHA